MPFSNEVSITSPFFTVFPFIALEKMEKQDLNDSKTNNDFIEFTPTSADKVELTQKGVGQERNALYLEFKARDV